MSVAYEKPHVPPTNLIEGLQSNEIEESAVSFAWPRVKEGCKKLEYITLGATPEDNFALLIYQTPLPQEFPQKFIDKFETYTDDKGSVFKYIQQGKTPKHASIERACAYLTTVEDYPPTQNPQSPSPVETERENQTPQISTEQLLEELKGKVCLIYTGAGISVEKGLPNSLQLKQQLGVDMNKDMDEFVIGMCDPEKRQGTVSTLDNLQQAFYGEPTPAHHLLGDIQTLTQGNIAIATENLDKLHEKTGAPVIPFGGISKIPAEYLQNVDFIVTIGLKQNFTGLVPRYKVENPRGKVVAVNLSPPPYSYPVDAYVLCEAQDFCSKLRDSVEKTG